jgi:hypothetical protein
LSASWPNASCAIAYATYASYLPTEKFFTCQTWRRKAEGNPQCKVCEHGSLGNEEPRAMHAESEPEPASLSRRASVHHHFKLPFDRVRITSSFIPPSRVIPSGFLPLPPWSHSTSFPHSQLAAAIIVPNRHQPPPRRACPTLSSPSSMPCHVVSPSSSRLVCHRQPLSPAQRASACLGLIG